jgi:hypothetical protein
MNCKQRQERILNSLAAGESVPAPELVAHRESCDACRAFYAAHADLLQSVDVGLRSIANQAVPPSLLPNLRARLDRQAAFPRSAFPGWILATVASAVILAVSIGYALRHSREQFYLPHSMATTVLQGVGDPQFAAPLESESPKLLPSPPARHLIPGRPSTALQVIVLAEECQAYARFVARTPRKEAVIVALASPVQSAPEIKEDTAEIALLQIDSLEVKLLEGTESE